MRQRGPRKRRKEKMVRKILLHFRRGGGGGGGRGLRARAFSPAYRRRGPTSRVCGACLRAREGSTCVPPPVSWRPLSRRPSETNDDSRDIRGSILRFLPQVMHVSCLIRHRRLPPSSPLHTVSRTPQLTYTNYMYLGLRWRRRRLAPLSSRSDPCFSDTTRG